MAARVIGHPRLSRPATFQITRSDGSSFTVSLSGATTVQDVIDRINTASGGVGVMASFGTSGNGIILTDTAGGSGTLTVTPQNASTAAADLGLTEPASGNTITGRRRRSSRAGVVCWSGQLPEALTNNDQSRHHRRASALQADGAADHRRPRRGRAPTPELQSRDRFAPGPVDCAQGDDLAAAGCDYASAATTIPDVARRRFRRRCMTKGQDHEPVAAGFSGMKQLACVLQWRICGCVGCNEE